MIPTSKLSGAEAALDVGPQPRRAVDVALGAGHLDPADDLDAPVFVLEHEVEAPRLLHALGGVEQQLLRVGSGGARLAVVVPAGGRH